MRLRLLSAPKICCLLLALLLSKALLIKGEGKLLHLSEIDGLPRNITTCIEKDQYGYLWIGTVSGIARYDGRNFYTYDELSSLIINYILID